MLNGREDCKAAFIIERNNQMFRQKLDRNCLISGTNTISVATTGSFDVERISLVLVKGVNI